MYKILKENYKMCEGEAIKDFFFNFNNLIFILTKEK